MRLRPIIALMCAILLLPLSSAMAQIRLSGTGVLGVPTSPFQAFSAGAVQFEFLIPQPSNVAPLAPAAFLLEGLGGNFRQGSAQVTLVGDLIFYTGQLEGGFSFESPTGSFLFDTFGEQLFTGSINRPLFREGTYTLQNFSDFPAVLSVQGDVTLTTVPEPTSLVLMLAGGVGLALVARRRRA